MQKQNSVVKIDRLLSVNQIILLVGGSLYGILYIFSGSFISGFAILLASISLPLLVQLSKKRGSMQLTISLITFAQLCLILFFGCISFNLAATFPLIAACLAMNCLYYNKQVLIFQWVLTDIVVFGALLFGGVFYPNLGIDFVLRGIIGLNFCVLFLYFLLKWGIGFMQQAAEKEQKSQELLKQVHEQMGENQTHQETQQRVFDEVRKRAGNLQNTTTRMLDIATVLKQGASEQTGIIDELSTQSEHMASEIKVATEKTTNSHSIAMISAQKLEENNHSMENVVQAITEIERSSEQIIGIIRSIEDIAFQTNILALNASVEAARAGEAGKGFAVVAEEVRMLATRSSKAASDSATLVDTSILNVQKGAKLIKETASDLGEVIEYSKSTAKDTSAVQEIMATQVQSIEGILEKMQQITELASQTARTAGESDEIANEISQEIRFINTAVRG